MSPKLPFGPQFPEGEKFTKPLRQESREAPADERQEAIAREAHSRLGDQFKKIGKVDKAIECYKKAGAVEKLNALREEFIQAGDMKRAEQVAALTNDNLTTEDYESIADNSFKDKSRVEVGYHALSRAGYQVEKVKELKNFSVFWKKEGVDLEHHSERMLDLGQVHESQSSWYEARSRYEDALMYAKKIGDQDLEYQATYRLKALGRKCERSGSLFNAFMAFKAAKSVEDLKHLAQSALLGKEKMENLALWVHEELIELEAEKRQAMLIKKTEFQAHN